MVTRNGENLIYEKESYLIRGACFNVYKKFGGAFKETIINKSLIAELEARGLKVDAQKRIDVEHRDKIVGSYVPDLIVNRKILIELKVKPFLTKGDEKQFWYYLRGSDYKLGFLINFGPRKLEIKRRIYDKARQKYN